MEVMIPILVGMLFIYLSFKLLGFLFRLAKSALGFIGPFIVAAIPGAGAYVVNTMMFGVGISEATLSGFITAAIAGTVLGAVS